MGSPPPDGVEERPLRIRPAVLLTVALWAAGIVAWSYAAVRLPFPAREGWAPEVAQHAPPLARYDSGWYRRIAREGYGPPPAPGRGSGHVFFPLYPMLTGAVSRLFGVDPFGAGMGVSLAALAGAAVLFGAEGRRRAGSRAALRALFFLLLFPTAFFLASTYAESLFLLLALAAFGCLARNAFAAAAFCGLLAGLTRLPALALALPLGIAAWDRARSGPAPTRRRNPWRTGLLVGLAPAAGVLLWVFGVGIWFGEPLLYFRLQEAWSRAASPLEGLVQWGIALPERIARGDLRSHPGFVFDYAAAFLFSALGVFQARRRRWADASWTAGALLLPVATGIAASMPRYLLVVYPAFFALEEVFRARPFGRRVWWIGSGALLLAATAAFVHWNWVA